VVVDGEPLRTAARRSRRQRGLLPSLRRHRTAERQFPPNGPTDVLDYVNSQIAIGTKLEIDAMQSLAVEGFK
jgi:hypothetical protein